MFNFKKQNKDFVFFSKIDTVQQELNNLEQQFKSSTDILLAHSSNIQFIIDSYVDMLLLGTAKEVYSSFPNSGYTHLSQALSKQKDILYNMVGSYCIYNEYHYGDNLMNLKFLYNIRSFIKKEHKFIYYYLNV
jgi:hypothetical protein